MVSEPGMPEDFYIKAARLGSDNTLEAGLDLSQSRQPSSLELVLSSAGGRIDGVVSSEQHGFAGALVVLLPESRHRGQLHLYKTTFTDQYGNFTLRGVAPGDYKLFAWEDAESAAYLNTDFLQAYEQRGEPIHVEEAGRVSAALTLIMADSRLE
jgi:hypothetical protein